jgi:hypothetical protein
VEMASFFFVKGKDILDSGKICERKKNVPLLLKKLFLSEELFLF